MYDISVLVPTRGRPKRVEEFLKHAFSNSKKSVEYLFYIDEDDQQTIDKVKEYPDLKFHIGKKPIKLSGTYNILYKMSSAPILCYGADDIIFKTVGWDELVINEFSCYKDGILLLYPAVAPGVPIHGFISRISCDILGYFFPPYFEHGYADRWLMDIYNDINRSRHCPALDVDHRHWHADKSLFDAVYHERSIEVDENNRTCDDRDKIIYDELAIDRFSDAEKLRVYMRSMECK